MDVSAKRPDYTALTCEKQKRHQKNHNHHVWLGTVVELLAHTSKFFLAFEGHSEDTRTWTSLQEGELTHVLQQGMADYLANATTRRLPAMSELL